MGCEDCPPFVSTADTLYHFDDLNRVVSRIGPPPANYGTWGTTPHGAVWVTPLYTPDGIYVDGSLGHLYVAASAPDAPQVVASILSGPWTAGRFTLTALIHIYTGTGNVAPYLNVDATIEIDGSGSFFDPTIQRTGVSLRTVAGQLALFVGTSTVQTPVTFAAGDYYVKWEYRMNGPLAQAKVWPVAGGEPGWMVAINTAAFTVAPVTLDVSAALDFAASGGPGLFSGHVSCDWIDLLVSQGVTGTPYRAQMVLDEPVGFGDGTTTAYTTHFGYLASSLQVTVAGVLAEVDFTDPATGSFTLVDPAPVGAPIFATYRAAGA